MAVPDQKQVKARPAKKEKLFCKKPCNYNLMMSRKMPGRPVILLEDRPSYEKSLSHGQSITKKKPEKPVAIDEKLIPVLNKIMKEKLSGSSQQHKRRRGRPLRTAEEPCRSGPCLLSWTNNEKVKRDNQINSTCQKRNRATRDDLDEIDEAAKKAVIGRAEQFRATLPPRFPNFVKPMLHSHVEQGFWLGLNRDFCTKHLPKQDAKITLEGENGKEFNTNYLVEKVGLSGGWRGFSLAHKLVIGDVGVFQLVRPKKFKVYIFRLNESDGVGVALSLLQLDYCLKKITDDVDICKEEHQKRLVPLRPQKDAQENVPNQVESASERSENDGVPLENVIDPYKDESMDDRGVDVLNGLPLVKSVSEFKQVESIEDFALQVNGQIINSELPKHVLTKYYELCCSQNEFLHENLIKGLNLNLVIGMIIETITIADAITASRDAIASREDFLIWDKILKAFQDMGMNIGFLRFQLKRLLRVEEEKRTLRAKIWKCTRKCTS